MDWNVTFSTPQINPEAAVFIGATLPVPPTVNTAMGPENRAASWLQWSDLKPNRSYLVAQHISVATFPVGSSFIVYLSPVSPDKPLGPHINDTTLNISATPTKVQSGAATGSDTLVMVTTDQKGRVALQINDTNAYDQLVAWTALSVDNKWELTFTELFI
jgi:hypothetical protein